MKIDGEEVELVTDFGSLRAGMIVWVTPCRWDSSQGAHRAMLVGPVPIDCARSPLDDSLSSGTGFECLPKPQCCRARRRTLMADCVADRIVYRVVDPNLAQATTRAREAVRT